MGRGLTWKPGLAGLWADTTIEIATNPVEEMMVDGCEERGEMAHASSEAERRFPRTREELFHAGQPSYYVGTNLKRLRSFRPQR